MATIRDVAKLSGVSVATVSRFINKSGYVNTETEEKIKESIKKLNYTPNSLARALASKKTDTIALIIPDITNPFFPELARAVEDTAKSLGYTLILGNSDSEGANELKYIEILKNRYVDGIIFASHQLRPSEVHELLQMSIPILTLDRAVDSGLENLPSISVNNYMGAVMGVEHLISIGCKNIAHISGPYHLRTSLERLRGYTDSLKNSMLFNASFVVQGDFTVESGLQATRQLMAENPEIDGIFAANDLMAIGALKALIRLGKKVPDDVALLGFDGIQMTQVMEPEISTVAQPIYEMGALAVRQLVSLIDKREIGKQVEELQGQLIQRASSLRRR
jgi:LacI family transcriptional regulator